MGWDSDGLRGSRHPIAEVFAVYEATEGGGRMKPCIVIITITTQVVHDATDRSVNGHYTAAQMRAALAAVKSNPVYSQYSDTAGVLQACLASYSTSGSATTTAGATQTAAATGFAVTLRPSQLDYTGGQPLVAFALGGTLIIAGAVLRGRWA